MSIVFKAKAEKKNSKKLVEPQKSFETKSFKNISSYFSFVLALKMIDAQML